MTQMTRAGKSGLHVGGTILCEGNGRKEQQGGNAKKT